MKISKMMWAAVVTAVVAFAFSAQAVMADVERATREAVAGSATDGTKGGGLAEGQNGSALVCV